MLNRRLFRAYVAKEQFEHAWSYTTAAAIRAFIVRLRRLLNWSRLKPLIKFWEMLMRHIDGVTAWAPPRLTNAALEATTRGCAASASAPAATATPATSCSCSNMRPGSSSSRRHPDARRAEKSPAQLTASLRGGLSLCRREFPHPRASHASQ